MKFFKFFVIFAFLGFSFIEAGNADGAGKFYNEAHYNKFLTEYLNGVAEQRHDYDLPSGLKGYILVDVATNDYVIEGGLDKRSSLDSIQQSLFASFLTGKKPAIAIYDTDNTLGKFEYRIFSAAKIAEIDIFWVRQGRVEFIQNSSQ